MAHSPRGWTGARTPQAIKRVRQIERRHAINQPRRSVAKTLAGKAILTATNGAEPADAQEALARAISAIDRAAKTGAIHPNAASRRKSRLTLKVNAALGGEALVGVTKAGRTTGKAAAAKQAKARIAAGKATKAKGAQTAAGKARAALTRTTREAATPPPAETTAPAPAKPRAARSGAVTKKSAAAGGDTEPAASPKRARTTRGSSSKS